MTTHGEWDWKHNWDVRQKEMEHLRRKYLRYLRNIKSSMHKNTSRICKFVRQLLK